MLFHKRNHGFTLIELLVVIAIIGILSSVVLASLNSARAKGLDAKVKTQISGLRASAEIYYDNNNSYGPATALCSEYMFIDADSGMLSYTTPDNYPVGADLTCSASVDAYAVSALLPGKGGTFSWCVDSIGNSMDRDTPSDPLTDLSCQ